VKPGAALLAALLSLGIVRVARADDPTPAMAGEKSEIKPVGERAIGKRERPTVKKRAEKSARDQRAYRVNLQIPQRLRALLEKKIDARISRDIAQEKQLRAKAHGLLAKFIAETPPGSPEMPEALLRIGELEWESARDDFLLKFHQWDKSPSDQRGPPPNPDYSRARARFLRVLKNYKTYRNYDLALYVDGFLANEEGKSQQAVDRFNKILSWFPQSRFVPDAHMFRAEYEFTKDFPNYQAAYEEYEKVLQYKHSELYDIALFKSAWCLWRLGRTDEAARRFLTVFKTATEKGAKAGHKRKAEIDELQREALKNLVAVFVEDEKNTAEDMYKFLVKAGGAKFAGKIVHALARAFYDQAHYERGIEAYRLLLKLEPADPTAYEHALSVAQGHSTMEEWKQLEKDYRWIIRDYTRPVAVKGKPAQGGVWTRSQTPATVAKAEAAIEKQIREDALGLHAKAQADKNSLAEYRWTAKLYEVYLSRFGKQKAAYEIYFNLAEIDFYHLGDDAGAADAYLAAVRLDPKGKLSRDALYNALSALESSRQKEFEAAKSSGKPAEETPTDKKLTEAMELYIKSYPDDPKIPELLFRQGKLYYDYGVYDPAVRQWGLLLEKFPKSKFSVGAGELILDSFNKSKDYQNIETWARRLKKAPAFQGAEQQARLDKLIVQAVFKQGEALGAKGEHKKAAQAYLRAAKEFPKEPRAAKAAVNAEVEARRSHDLGTLKAAAALLIKDHKRDPEAAQGLWIAATTYQSVGLYSQAADYDQTIVDSWPKYEHHKDAAYNAVLLRTTVGEHDKAIASGKQYTHYYSRDPDADEVVFLMGKAHEKAKKWKDAEALYSRYSRTARNANARIEALVRLATVRVKLKDERGAASALRSAMNVYKLHKGHLSDDGKYFAAKARYMQGERILAEYEKVKIEGDVKQLKARLKKKSALLKGAADTFLDTAKMGVAEWTTASLYQIGFTYESFSKALENSPPPASLSKQAKEQYSQQIDEFVVPIEERALEAYESGWLKAKELGIYNSWTAKMRAALGRLNSELYPPLEEIGFKLRVKGPSPMPVLIDGLRRTKRGAAETYLITPPKVAEGKGDASAAAKAEAEVEKARENDDSDQDKQDGDKKDKDKKDKGKKGKHKKGHGR
jgi:tetratricopeptide (TPR) repeat protein